MDALFKGSITPMVGTSNKTHRRRIRPLDVLRNDLIPLRVIQTTFYVTSGGITLSASRMAFQQDSAVNLYGNLIPIIWQSVGVICG